MRRTFDDLERAVLKLLAKSGSLPTDRRAENAGPVEPEKVAGMRSRADREAAELVRRAIKRLRST